jgi:hypothetical protein
MKSLLQKSAIPLISGLVAIAIVTLKLLSFYFPVMGFIGLTAMIVLLISSFKNVFLQPEDEIEE